MAKYTEENTVKIGNRQKSSESIHSGSGQINDTPVKRPRENLVRIEINRVQTNPFQATENWQNGSMLKTEEGRSGGVQFMNNPFDDGLDFDNPERKSAKRNHSEVSPSDLLHPGKSTAGQSKQIIPTGQKLFKAKVAERGVKSGHGHLSTQKTAK